MAEEREGKNPVQSAERIFQVMETLADHGEMGLMELSTALDLHKSTVHRLLMSLIYMGYAKQDEATQKYMLSYKVVNMAGKILERMDILQVAKPYMERLSDLSGEAVHLVQREGNHILYIYKIEAKVGTIRMVSHVGMVHPMYCSGVGKAIMATLPDEEVKKIWNESIIEKKTDKTITDFSQMQEVLEEVRQNGYALDDEENEKGVRCIAACLHGYQKEVKYAFSISGPTSRMTRERVKELAGGRFYMVHRPFRLAEIMSKMVACGIEPKRMQLVYPYVDKEPNMVLLEGSRGGRSRLTVEKPLIVYKEQGVYTDEIYDIYGY